MEKKHHRYTAGWQRQEGHRSNTDLQNLSGKRNWSTGVMIGGMIGGLRYLRRIWPGLDIQRAVWALQMIELDIDERWYKEKEYQSLLNETNKQREAQHAGREGQQATSQHAG